MEANACVDVKMDPRDLSEDLNSGSLGIMDSVVY